MTPQTATRLALRTTVIAASVLALAACQSARFGGGGPRPAVAASPGIVTATPLEPGIAAPTGVVESQPLAPPPIDGQIVATDQIVSDVPTSPQVAAIPAPTQAAPRASRTTFVGTWRASEPGGGSCRVTLSSTPSLDLYRASSSGCQNEDLSRVSAWDLRGDQVYLYRQGGAVAARLGASPGAMSGALSRSGAPVALSR
ncbi:AprI/Inh family metalloprotease inhibitor [Salinarimonas sp. NSM]|uniref:AprI/Inh family metalloprotease inhibitor n=1 Tax=Salinarimonas sp. NSM TaxID=3458003 RepID=UPI004036FADF